MNVATETARAAQLLIDQATTAAKTLMTPVYNVVGYGADPTGLKDSTKAFKDALAAGGQASVPPGRYLITETLALKNSSAIIGAGWNQSGSSLSHTHLIFAVPGGQPAITVLLANDPGTVSLKGLMITAKDWTSHTGYGLKATAPVTVEDCYFGKFPKANIMLTQDATQAGPYMSRFVNVRCHSSREHGMIVGTGANVVTLINCQFFWNGSPAYGVAPSVAGVYDGLYVEGQNAGNPDGVPVLTPQGLTILGGDASYNSRYGFNFEGCDGANISTGYAETNLAAGGYQIRLGANFRYSVAHFQIVDGGAAGIFFDGVNGDWQRVNQVYYGGQSLGGGAPGPSYTSFMLLNVQQYFAESADRTKAARMNPRRDANGDFTGEYLILTDGAAGILNLQADLLKLYQTSPRAGARIEMASPFLLGGKIHSYGTVAPTAGTWAVGDIVYNQAPAPSGKIGWVCTTAGTPGTWKPFGAIDA